MTEGLQYLGVAAISGICTAIPATILAVASLRQSKRNGELQVVNDAKTDKLIVKTAEIHDVTNSAKKAADENLAAANSEIANLKQMVGKLIEANAEKEKTP